MNPYDQFDAGGPLDSGNPYDKIDAKPKLGADAFPDFLRQELKNTDFGTRNIAAFGTALSDLWERAKQLTGNGDQQAILANSIMRQEAPVGAVAGEVAATAIPFGLVGNSVKGAAALGGMIGAARPVEGDQSFANIAKGTAKNVLVDSVMGGVGQKLANVGGGYLADKLAEVATQRAANAPKSQTLNDALDAGLKVAPSDANPSLWNSIVDTAAGGKAAVRQGASGQNAELVDNLMRKQLGLSEGTPLTPEVLQGRRDLAYQVGYQPLEQLPAVNWDQAFLDGLKDLRPKTSAIKDPAAQDINDILQALHGQNSWTGEQLMTDIRALREQASANFGAADRAGGDLAKSNLAQVQKKAADLLEGLAERNILTQGGNPQTVQMMRDARKYIAQTHNVEDALIQGSGTINSARVARMFQNGEPLTEELKTVGAFANNPNYGMSMQPRTGSPDTNVLRSLLYSGIGAGVGGAAGGFEGSGHGSLAGLAASFLAPRMARSYALSGMSQNALRDLYRLGLPTRSLGLLQNAPVGFTVLGGNALLQ